MDIVTTAAKYLHPVANALVFITTTKVHPLYFPYPLAPTLHAARISLVYQINARRSKVPLSWGTHIAGYLIMCWGGSFITHFMLGLPPPMLYSFHPYINYLGVHLVFTLLFSLFPSAFNPPILDTLLFPLDALLRTNAVTSTLALLSSPAVNPVYVTSPLTHLILGALASAGGGLSAATLSTWNNEWTFSTPPIFRTGAGVWGTMDVWGGALIALIYSTAVYDPAFSSLSNSLSFNSSGLKSQEGPLSVSPLSAKAVSAVVFGILFALRMLKVHWIPTSSAGMPKIRTAPPSKKAKAKKIQ